LEQAAAAEQEAGRGILDRERIAVHAIAGAELPFEIGGPDRIRLIERGIGPAAVKAAARGATAAGASISLENAMDRRDCGHELEQAAAAEQEAGRGILDRERIAVHAIAGAELPFEIGGPDRIRLIERGIGPAAVKAAARGATAAGASISLENAMDRRDCGHEL